MDVYDQDYRRLACRERVEQLARSARSVQVSRRRRWYARRLSVRVLLRPAAYRDSAPAES